AGHAGPRGHQHHADLHPCSPGAAPGAVRKDAPARRRLRPSWIPEFPDMATKKTAKAAEAEETKPKKTAVKKAVKEKAEPKPKAAKKAKTVEPEVAAEPVIESKKVAAKKPAKAAPDQGLGLTPHAEAILAAIREGRAVEFIFEDAEANAPRTFEPRQLIYDALAAAWFVW